MNAVIRRFLCEDELAVADLWQLVFPDSSQWNDPVADISRKMRVQPELFFVASVGRDVVGTIMAGYDGHRGWIYYVVVHPERRRAGLGRRLVAHAEQALRDIGCPKANLQIRAGNEAAVGFYQALGYLQEPRVSMGKRLRTQADTLD